MVIAVAACIVATYMVGTWLAGVAVAVLFLIWRMLRVSEGPSVIAAALTFQWMQVTVGIFYNALTGEPLIAITDSNYQTMVLLGLGCVTSLAVGLKLGMLVLRREDHSDLPRPASAFSWRPLLIMYVAATAATGIVQDLAWSYPTLTQAILALTFSRLALLFLMVRRLCTPVFQWRFIAVLMVVETVLGLTGYFAGFREPMIMAAFATIEVFDRRNAQHWLTAGLLVVILSVTSVLWMGVRRDYRQDFESEVFAESRAARLDRIRALTSGWMRQDAEQFRSNVTALVDRMWAIYYPALAVARVPGVLPHTDGSIIGGALVHLVTPRVIYPNKPELPSDSEMVRKYSGVWVASVEQDTSIAFGYAAESYVDFGVPMMFVPSIVYGFAMGLTYCWLMRLVRHRDLAVALVTVVFWLGLYLFERSWIKTLGLSLTLTVYLGGTTFLLDRFLISRAELDDVAPAGEAA